MGSCLCSEKKYPVNQGGTKHKALKYGPPKNFGPKAPKVHYKGVQGHPKPFELICHDTHRHSFDDNEKFHPESGYVYPGDPGCSNQSACSGGLCDVSGGGGLASCNFGSSGGASCDFGGGGGCDSGGGGGDSGGGGGGDSGGGGDD